jgi:hypothetical protein
MIVLDNIRNPNGALLTKRDLIIFYTKKHASQWGLLKEE